MKQLENANGWNRETAHRLLFERQDRSTAPLLSDMARKSANAKARLQALWVLEGIGGLAPELLMPALRDPEPRVRENALRLAESFLPREKALADCVLGLQHDPDARVRFQLALTLGRTDDPRALGTLASLATGEGSSDRWLRIAIFSAVADRPFQSFERLPARDRAWQDSAFLSQLAALDWRQARPPRTGGVHLRAAQARASLGWTHRPCAWTEIEPGAERRVPRSRGCAWPGHRRRRSRDADSRLDRGSLLRPAPPLDKGGVAGEGIEPAAAVRAAAIRALQGARFDAVQPVLRAVLDSNPQPEVQRAAVEALASFHEAAAGALYFPIGALTSLRPVAPPSSRC